MSSVPSSSIGSRTFALRRLPAGGTDGFYVALHAMLTSGRFALLSAAHVSRSRAIGETFFHLRRGLVRLRLRGAA
jgi:hypothetical protein